MSNRKNVSTAEIKAMIAVIQYAENKGALFMSDEEGEHCVKKAIEKIGIGSGVDWSCEVVKLAVDIRVNKGREPFVYKHHEALTYNGAQQIGDYLNIPFSVAKDALDKANIEAKNNKEFNSHRDYVTGKCSFETVVELAIQNILRDGNDCLPF